MTAFESSKGCCCTCRNMDWKFPFLSSCTATNTTGSNGGSNAPTMRTGYKRKRHLSSGLDERLKKS